MRRLYYSPGACSLAPHIVLEELGQPFATTRVTIRLQQHQTPEFLALNPQGRVPVLEDDQFLLTEAPAILLYLARKAPSKALIAHDDEGYGRTAQLLNYFSSSVHVAFAQVWRSQRFATTQAARDEVVALGRETVADGFERINTLLRGREWLVGDRFSVADTYPLVFFRWGGLIGLDMRRFEDWSDHTKRMLARPAVQRALATEEIEILVAS